MLGLRIHLTDNLELLIDRSIVLASAENYRAALLDLDRAYELAPQRPDVLVYRATVHRFLGSDTFALRDIEAAIQLDPNLPEAYLERGILKRMQGDRNGARRDWVRVLDLGSGTPAADAARVNLELLDVDPKIMRVWNGQDGQIIHQFAPDPVSQARNNTAANN